MQCLNYPNPNYKYCQFVCYTFWKTNNKRGKIGVFISSWFISCPLCEFYILQLPYICSQSVKEGKSKAVLWKEWKILLFIAGRGWKRLGESAYTFWVKRCSLCTIVLLYWDAPRVWFDDVTFIWFYTRKRLRGGLSYPIEKWIKSLAAP